MFHYDMTKRACSNIIQAKVVLIFTLMIKMLSFIMIFNLFITESLKYEVHHTTD